MPANTIKSNTTTGRKANAKLDFRKNVDVTNFIWPYLHGYLHDFYGLKYV